MVLLSVILNHPNPSPARVPTARTRQKAGTWRGWHKGADRGPASTSPEDRADRNARPKRPETAADVIVSELLQRHEIIDGDSYRDVTYIRRKAEDVAMERDFSQARWCPSQQPVSSLFMLQRLASAPPLNAGVLIRAGGPKPPGWKERGGSGAGDRAGTSPSPREGSSVLRGQRAQQGWGGEMWGGAWGLGATTRHSPPRPLPHPAPGELTSRSRSPPSCSAGERLWV